ncbi:MAG: hypothetical protein U0X20_24355 [Caldilineaceae bacterium]
MVAATNIPTSGSGLFQVLLAYEELAYLLHLLRVEPAVGVEDNALAGLPAEQVKLALAVAGRGLRARRLVRDDANGQPAIQNELLAALGTVGFPERMATVYHWAAGEELPAACYGYVRSGHAVLHQRPGPDLHEFTVYGTPGDLVGVLLRFSEATSTASTGVEVLHLPVPILTEMRRHAGQPAAAGALALLPDQAQRSVAARFLETLAAWPRVTAFTTLRSGGPAGVDTREFTFLQQDGVGWLLLPGVDRTQVMDIQAGGAAAVQALLTAALAD